MEMITLNSSNLALSSTSSAWTDEMRTTASKRQLRLVTNFMASLLSSAAQQGIDAGRLVTRQVIL